MRFSQARASSRFNANNCVLSSMSLDKLASAGTACPSIAEALRIEYDPQHTFHKESLEKHRKYLEEVVARVYGLPRVEIAFAQTPPASPRRKSKGAEARAKAELLTKTLGGEIVS
jgi:hypothetical protein